MIYFIISIHKIKLRPTDEIDYGIFFLNLEI